MPPSALVLLPTPVGWQEQRLTARQAQAMPGARVFHRRAELGVRLWVIVEHVSVPPGGWHLAVSTLRELHNPLGEGYLPANRRPTLEEVEAAIAAFLPAGIAVAAFWPPKEQWDQQHPTTWHVRQAHYGVPLPPLRRAQWDEKGMLVMAGVPGA